MIAHAAPGYAPYLMSAGIAFAMYRRIRSHFGRQPWRPTRTIVRVVLLSLLLAGLSAFAVLDPARNWGVFAGAAAGVALGLLSLHLMRVHVDGNVPGYTPNPWIGGALSALLIGRIAWRFASGGFTVPQSSSPLTLAIGATVLAFYLVQGAGLLLRMRRLTSLPAVTTP